MTNNASSQNNNNRKWWKEAVVYQIYPRSFKDTDGDGVGDLKGIIQKLDYIKSLGIDVIWLNPIFSSPNDDNGYDISDYRGIMKEFGTMKDFDELLKGMHQRKIKLVLDLVVNHSSDEHYWFQESRKSRTNPYRNYYHWWNAERGKPAHRFSFFDVDGSAWKYDSLTNAYYLHYFSRKQPDLNWENPKLRQEVYDMMNFWFKKGVDGFRMDVISAISKDTMFPQLPAKYNGDFVAYYADGPHLHEYLKEMNKESLGKFDVMSVAEGLGVTTETAHKFVDPERKELNMLYHFEGMGLGYLPGQFKHMDPKGYSLIEFKNVYSKWDSVFANKGWGTIYLGNHDQPRMVTRWGNDAPKYREASSKMLTTFLLTMRATPYYYFGDELGMNNIKFDKIEDYRDIETINMYEKTKMEGGDLDYFLEGQKISGRDNGRTPFQWDDTKHAGFTNGTPWLQVNSNYKKINAAAQENDPNSILNYFRKMVKLRKALPELVYGKYELLDKDNEKIYVHTRTLDNKKVLVLLNFSASHSKFEMPKKSGSLNVLMNNVASLIVKNNTVTMEPYQALIIRLL
ncbi:MAG TPA: alpha-glucosidase [Chitinophagaceae bacterium]|nr:alpha-glucosidase [Chitinophagaceae bacterium]